ncbi:Uncharacterized protein Fot_04679 [Forsythia ovata]|uniref:Uncharacterized protein n=1 Tax=Forsythia ovata TaxID=205694 RepID=A0ABD1XHC4_9LAMI
MDDCSLHLDPSRLNNESGGGGGKFFWGGGGGGDRRLRSATPPEQPSFEVPMVCATSARAAGDTGLKTVFSATSQLAVAAGKRSGPSLKTNNSSVADDPSERKSSSHSSSENSSLTAATT